MDSQKLKTPFSLLLFICIFDISPFSRAVISSSVCKLANGLDDGWLRLKRNCNGEHIPPSDGEASQRFFSSFFFFYFTVDSFLCHFFLKNHDIIPGVILYFYDSTRKG